MPKNAISANTTALRDETVLRHVRQLGSARDGLREWRLQRLTAIALIARRAPRQTKAVAVTGTCSWCSLLTRLGES
jgi:hypothetical protein